MNHPTHQPASQAARTMARSRRRGGVFFSTAALLASFASASEGQTVAITEFFNNPNGGVGTGDAGLEFIELFNYGTSAVDLTGFSIFDQGTGGGSGSFSIPEFTLGSGEYAVFLGTQSFGSNRQSADALKDGFIADYFNSENPFDESLRNSLFTLSTTGDDGLEDSSRALSNTADEIFLANASGNVVWNLAYSNDESGGFSTFLARDDFSTTNFGDIDNPGIDRSGPDNGSLSDIFYLENGASITGTPAGASEPVTVTVYDPVLGLAPGEPPVATPAGNVATPFAGFYTVGGGSGLGPADGFELELPELTASITTNQSVGAPVAELSTSATQTEDLQVKLVISAVADTLNTGARTVELTALADLTADELAQYGVSALNNGSSNLAVEANGFDLGRGISAGEKLYLVADQAAFAEYFADIDFSDGSTTPFPTTAVIAEGSGATALNGDDQIVLFIRGQEVDSVGVFGEDGTETAWEHEDGYIVRNDNVLPTFNFDVSDFIVKNNEYLDDDAGENEEGIGVGIVPVGATAATVFGAAVINEALESPRLALVNDAGVAVDENGVPVADADSVVLVDRTPFPIGSYDGSGINPADLPVAEVDIAGEYFFVEASLDTPLSAGSVDIDGYVPFDTVLVGFDIENPAGAPSLTELVDLLVSGGVAVTDLTSSSASIEGVTDNPLYDDYELLVELEADNNGSFSVDWDFSLFSLVGGFEENPVVTALGFGTVEAAVEFLVGDMNGDDLLTNADINPFVLALTDAAAYAELFAELNADERGDINQDGIFSNADINAFVGLLTANSTTLTAAELSAVQSIPEPTSLLSILGLSGLALSRRRRA
ncbi:MAG: lamin tail domain-containing protein [Planctomycetota bacterium]